MSEGKKYKVKARVQVTLDITIDGTWGPMYTVGGIYVQAEEKARDIVNQLLTNTGTTTGRFDSEIIRQITLSKMSTVAIITEDIR